jgi:hypothetical protein
VLRVRVADQAVLGSVERDLLNPAVREMSLYKALAALRPPDRDEVPGQRLRAELAKLEAEIGRLATAIAENGDLRALIEARRQREARRARLAAELDALNREPALDRDADAIASALDTMRQALADWQGMLRQDIPAARRALRALLAGRLTFTPQEREGERFYAFEGSSTVSPVIAEALPKAFGSPMCYRRALRK